MRWALVLVVALLGCEKQHPREPPHAETGELTHPPQRPECYAEPACAPACKAGNSRQCVALGDLRYEADESRAAEAYQGACQLGNGEGCRKAAEILWDNRELEGYEQRARDTWQQGCKLGDTLSCQPVDLDPRGGRFHLPDAPPSHAASARAAFEEGERGYNLGQYDVAVAAFKRAFELTPDPIFLYNLAQAYRMGGDDEQAVFFYKAYLRKAPAAKNRGDVEGRIHELEERLSHPVQPVPHHRRIRPEITVG